MQQLSDFKWPSGLDKTAAILRAAPDELRSLYGLSFDDGVDDLDVLKWAAFRLPSGRLVVLMRHRGEPGPGTSVYIDIGDSDSEARDELSSVLGLPEDAFIWPPR